MAKGKTEENQIEERVYIAVNGAIVNGLGTLKYDNLNSEIEKEFKDYEIDPKADAESWTVTVTENGIKKNYTIKSTGEVQVAAEIDIKIELSIAGEKVTTPPNPDSEVFEHTEGTIDTGYVIRDKDTGNEFVWVPVDSNQKITLNVTSTKENITEIKLYDPLGDEISLGTVSGKTYNNSNIIPTINGGYKAEVKTASGKEEKTLVVRSLYAKDTFLDDYYENIYTEEYCLSDEVFQKWNSNVGSPGDKATVYQRLGIADDAAFVKFIREQALPVKDYSDGDTTYADSVNQNGGFYIARYEAGATSVRKNGNSSDTVDAIITANGAPKSKANLTPYTRITYDQAKDLAESMYPNNSFTSTLPTGSAYDRVLGWLVNTNNKSLEEISIDSSEWGNYSNKSFAIEPLAKYSTNGYTYTAVNGEYNKPPSSVLLTTGAAPTRNVSNNIFDVAGNVCEWITEIDVKKPNLVGGRGGNFNNSGSSNTPNLRVINYTKAGQYSWMGFRTVLFLR